MEISRKASSCILSKFYIKPQHGGRRREASPRCILSKFYIKPQLSRHCSAIITALYLIEILHQTTTYRQAKRMQRGCILSKFYIKPQQSPMTIRVQRSCILSKFYIKPQHQAGLGIKTYRCILSKFYIKPQHYAAQGAQMLSCILSKFYIKPQLSTGIKSTVYSCILSKFYIKPQQCFECFIAECVVSYRNSTSNHNVLPARIHRFLLYLIEILHQTTTPSNP